MQSASVKAHIFKVVPDQVNPRSLESLLEEIAPSTLENRVRSINGTDIRLDYLERKEIGSARKRVAWFLDFARLRDTHGPGRTSRQKPVTGFELEAGDFFGEETAALYLPETNHIIVQYNHHGPRRSHIQEYFSSYSTDETNTFDFQPMLDPEAQATFESQKLIRKFEIGVDLAQLTPAQKKRGDALSKVAAAAAEMNGAKMKIIISVGQEKHGYLHGAKKLISRFVGKTDAVTSAIVTGRQSDDTEIETVDLITQKLVYVGKITPGNDRRLAQKDRFNFLQSALAKWQGRIDW